MKVALLLFGQPRFIGNLKAAYSYYSWILSRYETDIYGHAWWTSNLQDFDCGYWSNVKNAQVDPNTPKILATAYPNITIEYSAPIDFGEPQHFRDEHKIKSQLYTIQRVGEILKESGKINQYDFIILSRYDVEITEFPDLNTLDKDGIYSMQNHPGMADQIFIFSPNYIEFTSTYKNYDSLYQYDYVKNDPAPEHFKKAHFDILWGFHTLKRAPFNCRLIREL